MQRIKHLAIVAGEESGDVHAANFIKELISFYPDLKISGIGGRHMQEAGIELISDLARFGVTGLSEVITHFRTIKKAFNDMKAHLKANKPDLLILVDYPGFNLRLAKYAKKVLNIRIIYYISPQIWAWKANRIHTIRDCVDHMAVIFPFEKKIYEKAGVPASFVGHPLVHKIKSHLQPYQEVMRGELPNDKRIVALLPGSRTHEIERHMPVMVTAAKQLMNQYPDLHFIIPVARTISPALIKSYIADDATSFTLTFDNMLEAVNASDCVVVASGTASLECALLEKPMCIIYKASLLTYLAASKLVKVKYLGLCNLLQNAMIVPELLQYDCNPQELTRMIEKLLQDEQYRKNMVQKLAQLKQSISANEADCTITDLIKYKLNSNLN